MTRQSGLAGDLVDDQQLVVRTTPEQLDAARAYLRRHARDADDLRELAAVLGLEQP